jgi:hypothetical protein
LATGKKKDAGPVRKETPVPRVMRVSMLAKPCRAAERPLR